MSKFTLEDLQSSELYIVWKDLYRVALEYGINDSNIYSKTDLGGIYWEPFFDRLYKLGSMMGLTKKIKEIKSEWIRPIFYFGAQSTGIIEFDGRKDIVDKGAIGNASVLRFSFVNAINVINSFKNIDEKNYKLLYKNFKKEIKYFFSKLIKFVYDGFREMHNHIKLILKPLLDLRRSGYRLFSLEQYEKQNVHLTFFNDTKELTKFMDSSRDFFKWEKYKQSKNTEGDNLYQFLRKDTSQRLLEYSFVDKIRTNDISDQINPYATNAPFTNNTKKAKNKIKEYYENAFNDKKELPKIKNSKICIKKTEEKKLFFPNIPILKQPEPTQMKHEAYQLQFEEGLNSMIEYLSTKLIKDFPYVIDTHKIFVNIKYIPNWKENEAANYYLSQLVNQIEILKRKCYEMKLNGITRILMPITENKDIISVIKEIFDLHAIVDNVMGNFLLYDQYIFIYDAIKLIKNSNIKEQIIKIQNKYYMEEILPKYVIFQSLCHSVKVLEKMKKYFKEEKERPFKYEDSYQISKHELEQEDNTLIFAYEIYGSYKRFFSPELQQKKKLYEKEVKKFGKFWLMEGFFDKNDKKLWIEAIELLSNINELVREDIRDTILFPKEEKNIIIRELGLSNNPTNSNIKINENESKDSSSIFVKKNSNKILNNFIKNKGRKISSKKITKIKKKIDNENSENTRRIFRKKSTHKRSNDFFSIPDNININFFRPPSVWNYPIERLRKLKNEKIILDGGIVQTEIRDVDPTKCYIDGRIQLFKLKFNKLLEKMKIYWKGSKGNMWDYFFGKILPVLEIKYNPYKAKESEKNIKEKILQEYNHKYNSVEEININNVDNKKENYDDLYTNTISNTFTITNMNTYGNIDTTIKSNLEEDSKL